MLPRDRRFVVAVKLNYAEREALRRLSEAERLPMAQCVRRLIWLAAQEKDSREERDRDVPGGEAKE